MSGFHLPRKGISVFTSYDRESYAQDAGGNERGDKETQQRRVNSCWVGYFVDVFFVAYEGGDGSYTLSEDLLYFFGSALVVPGD